MKLKMLLRSFVRVVVGVFVTLHPSCFAHVAAAPYRRWALSRRPPCWCVCGQRILAYFVRGSITVQLRYHLFQFNQTVKSVANFNVREAT